MRIIILIVFSLGTLAYGQNLHLSSGIILNSSSVTIENNKNGKLIDYNSTRASLGLNLLFEPKSAYIVSFKTGIFFHPEYFEYDLYFSDYWAGKLSWKQYTLTIKRLKLDFPFLMSVNLSESNTRFSIDGGFYLGYVFYEDGYIYPEYFAKSDLGAVISAGIGSEKWQFTCYCLIGLKNLIDEKSWGSIEDGEMARCFTLGFNVTRVISLR
jgi:hypothetical protein